MEEQKERRNVGEKEGVQPSRNSGQSGPEPREHRIDIVEISPRVKNWIEAFKKAEERTQSQTQWPRILKVPHILKGTQDIKKFYEPRVISFGPYHHGKSHLRPGEMIKPPCAQNFLADSNQDIDGTQKSKVISRQWGSATIGIVQTSMMTRHSPGWCFWMGVFLLQFIRSTEDDSTVDLSNVLRIHQINFVVRDLFLPENQLPFGVLELIFEEAKFKGGSIMQEKIKKSVTPDNRRPDGSA